jgi:hypothetical protein
MCDIWVTESLPVRMDREAASGEISIHPPKNGFPFEEKEALLRPGDSIVVRGSMHTWSNRGDVPCAVTSLMMGATN